MASKLDNLKNATCNNQVLDAVFDFVKFAPNFIHAKNNENSPLSLHCFQYYSLCFDIFHIFQVSEVYAEVFKVISQPPVKDYVPFSWASLVHVKKEHYRALAHYYVAVGILDHKGEFGNKTLETLQFLHEEDEDKVANLIEIRVPQNQNERRYLGRYF